MLIRGACAARRRWRLAPSIVGGLVTVSVGASGVLSAQASAPGATHMTQVDPPPWVAPARPASRANPLPTTPAVVRQGQALYRANCELCHGARGAGDGQMAASLPTRAAHLASRKVQSQSDGALFWKILQGRSDMPTTQVTLTDDERWAIVRFLRTFAKRR